MKLEELLKDIESMKNELKETENPSILMALMKALGYIDVFVPLASKEKLFPYIVNSSDGYAMLVFTRQDLIPDGIMNAPKLKMPFSKAIELLESRAKVDINILVDQDIILNKKAIQLFKELNSQ